MDFRTLSWAEGGCGVVLIVLVLAAVILIFFISGQTKAAQGPIRNWVCYYGTQEKPEAYNRFDLVVLDGFTSPVPAHTADGKPLLLGYVSVGEVAESAPYWDTVRNKSFLVKKNDTWQSWIVDLRDRQWQTLLLERLMPAVAARGFDGFFLDTLDSVLFLAHGRQGADFAGMDEAAIAFVKKLRKQYPEKLIAVNRGLPILAKIAPYIDYIVIENLYSQCHKEKGCHRVDEATQNVLLEQVSSGLRGTSGVTVLTVDYASTSQEALAREAITYSRKKGFVPYVGSYLLDEIFFYTLEK